MKVAILLMMALGTVCAFGAQCEGVTKEGVRCKREAAEKSRFCIGHADQAKKTPAAKKPDAAKKTAAQEKDDGQCWAVTLAGTRCKHKKDGEKDYCKQHAANIKVKTSPETCRAMTYEGKPCSRKPDAGYNYCAQHRK